MERRLLLRAYGGVFLSVASLSLNVAAAGVSEQRRAVEAGTVAGCRRKVRPG